MIDLLSTLPAVFAQLEQGDEARAVLAFIAWRKAAGEILAEHAAAFAFVEHRLKVAVSGLAWRRHLEDMRPQLIFKMNAMLGQRSVRAIEFIVDEDTVKANRRGRTAPADRGPREALADEEITPELAEAAGAISDPELRQAFLAAAGICLLRRSERKDPG